MAGLDPAIHALIAQDMDAQVEPAHDEKTENRT